MDSNLQDFPLFKDIPEFEGRYLAHKHGFIVSIPKTWIGATGMLRRRKENRTLKPSFDKDGYARVTLMKDNVPYYFRVNRLIAMAFHPNPNNLPQVNHNDGKKLNNTVWNLSWCTDVENKRHAWAAGLYKPPIQKTGAAHSKSKLTEAQAAEIRASKEPDRVLAKKYGIDSRVVYGIKKGFRYPVQVLSDNVKPS